MIVKEENVSTSLAYLAETDLAAQVQYVLSTCENKVEETYSRLFVSVNDGTDKYRDALTKCNPEYIKAKSDLALAKREFARHKAEVNNAEKVIDTWRTENANVRASERIR